MRLKKLDRSEKDIKSATDIEDSELQRQLQSLACAKFKVLKKHPPSREVSTQDSFSFNADFSSPLHNIKISTIASKVETADERKETKDRVEEERRYSTDVCTSKIERPSPRLLIVLKGVHCEDYEGQKAYDT